MTSIVGVLNKHAVAIAADSAVTIGGRKVFNSANKIFALSKRQPVAVAMYNNTDLISVPWEVIIKEYRRFLGDNKHPHLKDYVTDFFRFLFDHNYYTSKEEQVKNLYEQFVAYIKALAYETHRDLKDGENFESKFIKSLINLQSQFEQDRKPNESMTDVTLANFVAQCEEGINLTTNEIKNISKQDVDKNIVSDLLYSVFCCRIWLANCTGLVFAGYGDEDIYPSIYSYQTQCVINGKLSYAHLTGEDCEIGNKWVAAIRPFAQRDVMDTIIFGVAPSVKNTYSENFIEPMRKMLTDLANQLEPSSKDAANVLRTFALNGMESYRDNYMELCDVTASSIYMQPFVNSVIPLDREDLAEFAESLIKLTSIKRKISLDQSTVGGPIDVMVISKGEGIIWMKRKHYFDPKLNHSFFDNYFK